MGPKKNSKLTKKQMKQAFKDHDTNDSGLLDGDYLYKALLSLSLPVETSDIPDLFECVGREKEKLVGLDDFVDIVTELQGGEDEVSEEEDLEEEYISEEEESGTPATDAAYQMLIDPAVNGITLESLLKVCATQEDSWTRQKVLEMMNEADLNHDGMIDPKEFKILCKKAGL